MPRLLRLILPVLLAGAVCARAEVAYWVWHRDTPLKPAEIESLQRQGVRALYWHIGTLRPEGEAWRVQGQLRYPRKQEAPFAIVPVLRFSTEGKPAFTDRAAESASRVLTEALRKTGAAEAQIDYDCPDRRLAEYAAFLAKCRAGIAPAKLSVTALAGWSRVPAFAQLQASADRLLPMFYDLQPDAPAEVRAGKVLPVLDPARVERQLATWRACKTPWLAGLPNFARVTVFDPAGRSRGHLREWEWDSICFHPSLLQQPQAAPGVTLFHLERDTSVAGAQVLKDGSLACRRPELPDLARAIAAAKANGAAGISMFRLPGAGTQGGWSLAQMETLLREGTAAAPELKLVRRGDSLVLTNVSAADLPPRLSGPNGPHDRGWQLEIESNAGAVFREAGPGEFARIFGHSEPNAPEPRPVALAMAERLTYWFSELRARESRQSGLLQLAPAAESAPLRWRIPGSPRNSDWQVLE